MLSAEESAELRSLQTKAYGPGSGASAAEVARLQELERLRLPSVAQPVSSRSARSTARDEVHAGAGTAPAEQYGEGAAAVEQHGVGFLVGEQQLRDVERAERVEGSQTATELVEASSPSPSIRRRWPLFIAASAAILAIGFGIGWGIWGWDSGAFALEAAHAEQRAELEAEGIYDPGTIVPLAEQYGVVVWRADRSDGDEICVIVTGPDQPGQGCIPSEELKNSVWPNANTTVPEGQEKAGQQLVAGLITSASGELVPFIQVWDQTVSGLESQYNDEELAQLHELEAAGYEGSTLSIIGYDGDRVVWSNWASGDFCVIASPDGGLLEACAPDATSDLTLAVVVDGVPTEYVVRQSEMRGPQLTVVRNSNVTKVEVAPGSDDPIEFGIDDPTFDDLTTDGETGETGG